MAYRNERPREETTSSGDNAELRRELRDTETRLERSREEIDRLQTALNEQTLNQSAIFSELEQDNDSLRHELRDVKFYCAELEQDNDSLRRELRDVKFYCAELEQDNDSLRRELRDVKSKLEQDNDTLRRELHDVKSRMVEKAGQPDPTGWGTISLCTPSGYHSCRIIEDEWSHKHWNDILHGVRDNCGIDPPPFLLPASMGGWMMRAEYLRVRAKDNNLSVYFGLRNDPYNETVQPFRARIAFRIFNGPNGQLLFSGEVVGQFIKVDYGHIVAEVPIADFDINTLPYMDCTICKEYIYSDYLWKLIDNI